MQLSLKNLPRIKSTIKYIPKGESGTKATIAQMKDWAPRAAIDPYIFSLARQITQNSPEGDKYADAKAIHSWVVANIKYKEDVDGVETLVYPVTLAKEVRQGDCDCQSTLVASLLLSIGIPARFVTAKGSNSDTWEHVFTEANINGEWIGVDTTDRVNPFGYKYTGIRKNFDISTQGVVALKDNNTEVVGSQDPLWLQVAQKATGFMYSISEMKHRGDITENDLIKAQESIINVIPSEGDGTLNPKVIKRIPSYCNWWKKSKNVYDVVSTPTFKLTSLVVVVVIIALIVRQQTSRRRK